MFDLGFCIDDELDEEIDDGYEVVPYSGIHCPEVMVIPPPTGPLGHPVAPVLLSRRRTTFTVSVPPPTIQFNGPALAAGLLQVDDVRPPKLLGRGEAGLLTVEDKVVTTANPVPAVGGKVTVRCTLVVRHVYDVKQLFGPPRKAESIRRYAANVDVTVDAQTGQPRASMTYTPLP